MMGRGKEERKQSNVAACDKAKERKRNTTFPLLLLLSSCLNSPPKKQLPQLLKADDVCTKH